MICPKCHKRFGLLQSGHYANNDEYLCWSCMYQDDIEREMLTELNEDTGDIVLKRDKELSI